MPIGLTSFQLYALIVTWAIVFSARGEIVLLNFGVIEGLSQWLQFVYCCRILKK
jgi:hypothetical protein